MGIGFAGLGWLLVWFEKEVTLRSRLNTKFGLEEKKSKDDTEENKIEGENQNGNETQEKVHA